jgi:16S rRNA (uracil1498-N3)-methyltransferase
MSGARRRLFVPDLPAAGGELELPPDSAHHARVLRLELGAEVELFDGRSGRADATLTSLTRTRTICRAGPRCELTAAAPALHVVLGLPKGSKLEPIVRMLTELGAHSLHLAVCERSVPRPQRDDGSARLPRLQRIALEACAQSGQPRAPELHAPAPLLEVATKAPISTQRLVFWERATGPLRALPAGHSADVWAVVGPEGGLSEAEVDALVGLGFEPVGLGPALLRVETAVPVIAALLLDRIGRFGG